MKKAVIFLFVVFFFGCKNEIQEVVNPFIGSWSNGSDNYVFQDSTGRYFVVSNHEEVYGYDYNYSYDDTCFYIDFYNQFKDTFHYEFIDVFLMIDGEQFNPK